MQRRMARPSPLDLLIMAWPCLVEHGQQHDPATRCDPIRDAHGELVEVEPKFRTCPRVAWPPDRPAVEVASNLLALVAVRDSKNLAAPALVVAPAAWPAFLGDLKKLGSLDA
ncbi:DUF397 domain-containing protein [Sphaerisporangium krabiense]|uniref:DUF397 domain-containing protein n=1 Tax=Sphaerisporangium krabiense TaxID=763782 RepID=A0A7W8Z0V3_9ACTN|nr:DUF397 domain-containing protein [Sphaerisporangium krabiense]MBB5625392.1 hypothetical protein [Sphaerisporangium krabiense]